MVEAGCWQGGSSAKFSLICGLLGYTLRIYDSFQGVEPLTTEERAKSYDFSGQYASPEAVLRSNLSCYGNPDVCRIYPGWFAETLSIHPIHEPIRGVYIDCDVAKGTFEALVGVTPGLSTNGWVFSQDFHFPTVRDLLNDPGTWQSLGRGQPSITVLSESFACFRFSEARSDAVPAGAESP
jgi:O-methyltransferase